MPQSDIKMECRHGHHHSRHHHHHPELAEGMSDPHVGKLKIVLCLSLTYFTLLVIGSYFSGSIALLAEAGHKMGDTGAIGLALVAAWFARLQHAPGKTFGYARVEILSALLNGVLLASVAAFVVVEASQRLTGHDMHHFHSHSINGEVMLPVAMVGFVLNLVSVYILHSFKENNLNVKGAYFHIMADVLGSLGTMVSAVLIMLFHWEWADALFGIGIAVLILWNAIHIIGEALHILMESVPRHIDMGQLRTFVEKMQGVVSVHDLHVWTITTGKDALLAHVVVDASHYRHETTERLESALRDKYGLCHITLQLEPPGFTEDEPPF